MNGHAASLSMRLLHRIYPLTMTTQPRRTQQDRVEESSRRLAEAAVALIAEQGYGATTAQQIGLRAGYSRDMVRVRFGTKEALVDSILKTLYEDRFTAAPAEGASGAELLLQSIRELREFAIADPVLLRAMFVLYFEAIQADDLLRKRVTEWLDTSTRSFLSAIRIGQADGTIDRDLPAIELSTELLSTLIGYAYLWIVNPAAFDLAGALDAWLAKLARTLRPS